MGVLAWNLLVALALVALGSAAGTMAADLVSERLRSSQVDPLVRRLVVGWVRPLVLLVAILAALRHLGVDLTSAIALLGAGALAVGLALQSSLSNIAAGALLLSTRPYRGDDVVTLAGHTGTVSELALFHTVVQTPDGRDVILPNNRVLGDAIINFSSRPHRRVDVVVTVDPSSDPALVERALASVLVGDERIMEEPGPSVVILGPTPLGMQLRLSLWVANEHFGAVRNEAHRVAWTTLREASITIATQPRGA